MNSVYMVYSDDGLEAVFSTRKGAQTFCAAFPGMQHMSTAEEELDPQYETFPPGQLPFVVHMLADGSVYRVRKLACIPDTPEVVRCWRTRIVEILIDARNSQLALYAAVFAHNEQHAIQLVNEKRIRFLLANQWSNGIMEDSIQDSCTKGEGR